MQSQRLRSQGAVRGSFIIDRNQSGRPRQLPADAVPSCVAVRIHCDLWG